MSDGYDVGNTWYASDCSSFYLSPHPSGPGSPVTDFPETSPFGLDGKRMRHILLTPSESALHQMNLADLVFHVQTGTGTGSGLIRRRGVTVTVTVPLALAV